MWSISDTDAFISQAIWFTAIFFDSPSTHRFHFENIRPGMLELAC
jgi:hypothetical protein